LQNSKINIIFVCLGNIVRSPLAEHMFQQIVQQAGKSDEYYIESGGTAGYHVGESPDARMRNVAAENGLIYTGKAQKFTAQFYNKFDLIIVMDQSNKANVLLLATNMDDNQKVQTLRTYDTYGNADMDVPDPYYNGIEAFQGVYEIVARSCQTLFETLESRKD
jgi:protein-tyrosine phosphatase